MQPQDYPCAGKSASPDAHDCAQTTSAAPAANATSDLDTLRAVFGFLDRTGLDAMFPSVGLAADDAERLRELGLLESMSAMPDPDHTEDYDYDADEQERIGYCLTAAGLAAIGEDGEATP